MHRQPLLERANRFQMMRFNKTLTNRPIALDNMLKKLVADEVGFEPVSTPKFPANREINREFSIFWAKSRHRSHHSSNDSRDL